MSLLLAGFFALEITAVRESSWGEKRDAAALEEHPPLPNGSLVCLEISDAAADGGVLRVARGVPEGAGVGVVVGDQRGDAAHPAV